MSNALSRVFRGRKSRNHDKKRPEEEGLVLMKSPRNRQNLLFPQFTVVGHEKIVVMSRLGSLFLSSLRTGNRLQSYKRCTHLPHDVELLEDGIFAEVGTSIVARRISDGTELDSFDYKTWFHRSASLRDGRFLVTTLIGEVLEMQWSKTGKLLHQRTVHTALPHIKDISVCKDRFAIIHAEEKHSSNNSLVSVFEVTTFELIANLEVLMPCRIFLTDHLLVIGCLTGDIFLYNSLTLELVRKIRNHSQMVNSLHILHNGRRLLSGGWDGLICIHDIETGALVWQKLFNTGVHGTALLSDGRLVAGFGSGPIVVLDIPRDLESTEFMIPFPTPLRDAFESCISGAEKPSEKCKELITYEKSRVSFDEWCSAHQVLMMAVEDGDIPRSRNYNGEISWWLENLYIAGKDIQLGSDDEARTMKRYLVEAEKMGVVDGIEPVLTAIKVTKDLKAEVCALQRADILLLERVMSIEARLGMLKESFERYRRYARNSQLIGVALQIIPIAGGSVAGMVSAGAEIVEGLSWKDMTDYFLGLGTSVLLDDETSMSDLVFRTAAAALRQEQLEKMNAERRRKLEEEVKSWGLSVSRLRELFVERGQHGGQSIPSAISEVECQKSGVSGSDDEQGEAEVIVEELPESEALIANEAALPLGQAHEEIEWLAHGGPSSWKDFKIEKDSIRGLSQEQLASVWAAYIVWNADARQEEYELLQKCLDCVMKEEHLIGELIVDSSALSSDELVTIMTTRMEEKGVELKAGDLGRVRQFVSAVQKDG